MSYASVSDDYSVNLCLGTEMELPLNRETVLHFFEALQKKFPKLKNFYSREKGEFVLEEEKERGFYRWIGIEPKRLTAGHVNPESLEEALLYLETILELAPYYLSLSGLDCEVLDLMYGFDFSFRGNHNQLVAEALGVSPALDELLQAPNTAVVLCEPSLTFALDEDFRWQCRVSVETRTHAYAMRMREFPDEPISVCVTSRRYGSLDANSTFVQVLRQHRDYCQTLCDKYVIKNVLRPLQQAIASS